MRLENFIIIVSNIYFTYAEYRVVVGKPYENNDLTTSHKAVLTMDKTIGVHEFNQNRNFRLEFKKDPGIADECKEELVFSVMVQQPNLNIKDGEKEVFVTLAKDKTPKKGWFSKQKLPIYEFDMNTNDVLDYARRDGDLLRNPNRIALGGLYPFYVQLRSENCKREYYESTPIYLDVSELMPSEPSKDELFYRIFLAMKNKNYRELEFLAQKHKQLAKSIYRMAQEVEMLKTEYQSFASKK